MRREGILSRKERRSSSHLFRMPKKREIKPKLKSKKEAQDKIVNDLPCVADLNKKLQEAEELIYSLQNQLNQQEEQK